jgi:hypothetical protein
MQDEAAHIEVPGAAGTGAVEARPSRPRCENIAFLGILPSLFLSLLSRRCEFLQRGGLDRLICRGIQWSIIIKCERILYDAISQDITRDSERYWYLIQLHLAVVEETPRHATE